MLLVTLYIVYEVIFYQMSYLVILTVDGVSISKKEHK